MVSRETGRAVAVVAATAAAGYAWGTAMGALLDPPASIVAILAAPAIYVAVMLRLVRARERAASMPWGVYLALADGGYSRPLPVEYTGRRDGMHTWVAVAPIDLYEQARGVRVAVLPARTGVTVVFRTTLPEAAP